MVIVERIVLFIVERMKMLRNELRPGLFYLRFESPLPWALVNVYAFRFCHDHMNIPRYGCGTALLPLDIDADCGTALLGEASEYIADKERAVRRRSVQRGGG